MVLTRINAVVALLLFPSAVGAQTQANRGPVTHDCHVYAVNLAQARKLVGELMSRPNARPEDIQAASLKTEQILGRFKAEVGEEVATTKSYSLPGTDLTVTATVFYTDEMMRLAESMLQALVVAKGPVANAMVAPGASISQVNFDEHTYKLLVKVVREIKGQSWVIGLECQCFSDEERRKQLARPRAGG